MVTEKNTKMEVQIAVADLPTRNGRIYPRAVLEQISKKQELLASIGMPDSNIFDLSKAAAMVTNMRVTEDGRLVGTVTALKTPAGLALQAMSVGYQDHDLGFDVRLAGTGKVDENGVVSDYTVTSVGILAKGTGA